MQKTVLKILVSFALCLGLAMPTAQSISHTTKIALGAFVAHTGYEINTAYKKAHSARTKKIITLRQKQYAQAQTSLQKAGQNTLKSMTWKEFFSTTQYLKKYLRIKRLAASGILLTAGNFLFFTDSKKNTTPEPHDRLPESDLGYDTQYFTEQGLDVPNYNALDASQKRDDERRERFLNDQTASASQSNAPTGTSQQTTLPATSVATPTVSPATPPARTSTESPVITTPPVTNLLSPLAPPGEALELEVHITDEQRVARTQQLFPNANAHQLLANEEFKAKIDRLISLPSEIQRETDKKINQAQATLAEIQQTNQSLTQQSQATQQQLRNTTQQIQADLSPQCIIS